MSKDFMFKTSAFGGFKKEEVMNFIENVLNEKNAIERQLAADSAKIAQLNNQVAALQSEAAEVSKLRSEITELSAKINEYEVNTDEKNNHINELNSIINDYKAVIDNKDILITKLTTELSEVQSKLSDDSEINELKRENERLKLELNKKGDLERQVGAAMLDARVHSEELVEQAKARANEVTKAVYSAIGDTAVKIDDLSAGIGEIARNFTKSVEEVELRIKALTGDMSKTAQALIAENVLSEEEKKEASEVIKVFDFSSSSQNDSTTFDNNIGDEDY